jgi:hypothetical protein
MSVKSIVVNEDVRDEVRQARFQRGVRVLMKTPHAVFWITHMENVRRRAIEHANDLCDPEGRYGLVSSKSDRRFALNALGFWKKMYREALVNLKSHKPLPLP